MTTWTKRGIVALCVWIPLYIVTAAGMTTYLEHYLDIGGRPDCQFIREQHRQRLSFALGWALIPLAPLVAPFITGFYEHGFSFKIHEGCRT